MTDLPNQFIRDEIAIFGPRTDYLDTDTIDVIDRALNPEMGR